MPLRSRHLIIPLALLLASITGAALLFPVKAATGINPHINYQGRLTDSQGAVVANTALNFTFKLYNVPSGGTSLWTEVWDSASRFDGNLVSTVTSGATLITYVQTSQEAFLAVGDALYVSTGTPLEVIITGIDTTANTISITPLGQAAPSGAYLTTRILPRSGLFSARLGSITSLSTVDFNQDALYLGVTVGSDSEMAPRRRLTSVPQAFNASALGGVTSTQFLRSDVTTTLSVSSTSPALSIRQGSGANAGPALRVLSSPVPSNAASLLQLSTNPVVGGSTAGTFVAANIPTFSGNFLDFQVASSSKFIVDAAGSVSSTGAFVFAGTATSTLAGGLVVIDKALAVQQGSGNVGVGVASPQARLHVSSTGFTTTSIRVTTNDTTSGVLASALLVENPSGARRFSLSPTGTAYFAGNVAIGTTTITPQARLELLVGTSAGGGIRFIRSTDGANIGELYANTAGAELFLTSTMWMDRLLVNNISRNSGNLAISSPLDVAASAGLLINSVQGDGAADRPQMLIQPVSTQISPTLQVRTTGSGGVGFHIDPGGSVGVGTISPAARLHVTTTATVIGQIIQGAASQATGLLVARDSSGTAIFSVTSTGSISSAGTFTFSGSASSTIAGALGIGTTAPGALLHVSSTASQVGQRLTTTANADALQIQNSAGANLFRVSATGAIVSAPSSNTNAAVQFQNAAGTTIFDIDTANQQVGIGTATPGSKLDVVGLVRIASATPLTPSSGRGVEINFDPLGFGAINSIDRGTGLAQTMAYVALTHSFQAGGAERLFLDNTGNIGIGTGSPAALLHVSSTAAATVAQRITANAGQTADLLQIQSSGGSDLFRVSATGGIVIAPSSDTTAALRVSRTSTTVPVLNVDTLNNRVGIGTANPAVTLQVGSPNAAANLTVHVGTDSVTQYVRSGVNTFGLGSSGSQLYFANDDLIIGADTVQDTFLAVRTANRTLQLLNVAADPNAPIVIGAVASGTAGSDYYLDLRQSLQNRGSANSGTVFINDILSTASSVGVGTQNAAAMLHVSSTGASTTGVRITINPGGGAATANPLVIEDSTGNNLFRISATGTVFSDSNYNCGFSTSCYVSNQAADLAELTEVAGHPREYQTGDLVAQSPEEFQKVVKATLPYESRLYGVVTDRGTFLGNPRRLTDGVNAVKVALVGYVKARVSAKNGMIRAGDWLTSSDWPGVAMRATRSGRVIGMAREPYTDPDNIGSIEILAQPGVWLAGADGFQLVQGSVAGSGGSAASPLAVSRDLLPQNIRDAFLSNIVTPLREIGITLGQGVIKTAKFLADIIESKIVRTEKLEITSPALGQLVIPRGTATARIPSSEVRDTSKVFLAPREDPGSRWWVSSVEEGAFSLTLAEMAKEDLTFDYWVVQKGSFSDAQAVFLTPLPQPPQTSPSSTPTPRPSPAATPAATPTPPPSSTSTAPATPQGTQPRNPQTATSSPAVTPTPSTPATPTPTPSPPPRQTATSSPTPSPLPAASSPTPRPTATGSPSPSPTPSASPTPPPPSASRAPQATQPAPLPTPPPSASPRATP